MTRTELLPEIMKLDVADQLMIAEAIRNHLAGGLAPVDEEEFKRELDRRLEYARAHPDNGISWEELSGELDAL